MTAPSPIKGLKNVFMHNFKSFCEKFLSLLPLISNNIEHNFILEFSNDTWINALEEQPQVLKLPQIVM